MKKYMINPITGEQTEIKAEDKTEMLQRNVRELQGQLAEAQKRIIELNDQIQSIKSIISKTPNDQTLGGEIRNILNESI